MSIFERVPKARVPKSTFDLSHSRKLSMRMGELVPVLVQEVVPGDKFNISTESMIRLAPMIAPVMHRMNSTIHYFFVPNRILWDDWEDFITGVPGLVTPVAPLPGLIVGSLGDHMGLPCIAQNEEIEVNMLPFRAYQKIYNDYYRDQNLEEEVAYPDEDLISSSCFFRAWEKDYFTSALTSPQKGEPVSIEGKLNYLQATRVKTITGGTPESDADILTNDTPGFDGSKLTRVGSDLVRLENVDSVSIEVEELRQATRLQRWLERNARSGNRYFEHLLAHWGVRSKDARLQRAEYLGGGKTPVVISEVPNMTGTSTAPQGTLAGNGLSVGRSNRASKFVEEHGYIIAIMSVIPETAYFQGVPRHFDRKINLDYYYPEFAQLGEQEIKNQEIYGSGTVAQNEGTFGYQSRYAEYKYNQNTVHGHFKSDLEFWHMGRKFAELPELNVEFIRATGVSGELADPWRIFAVTGQYTENLYVNLYHQISATRPMPFLNDPTL